MVEDGPAEGTSGTKLTMKHFKNMSPALLLLLFTGCSAMHMGGWMQGRMTAVDGKVLDARIRVAHVLLGSASMEATDPVTKEAFTGKYTWSRRGVGLAPCAFNLAGDKGSTLTGQMTLNVSPIWSQVQATGEAFDSHTNRYLIQFPLPK
jgi:hypothetical protein